MGTKRDLEEFKMGTQQISMMVRNRLQTDIDDGRKATPEPVHIGERPSPSPSPEVEQMAQTLNKESNRKRGRSFQTRKGSGPMVLPETMQEEPGERLPEELPNRALRAES